MFRNTLFAVGLIAAVVLQGQAQAQGLTYLGQQVVATGTLFQGTTVGGLSGIDYNPATGRYLAISDDRSAINPARYYELSLDLSKFQRSNTPGSAGVGFLATTPILTAAGATHAANTVDPEGLRLNRATGTLYWTNEGQRTAAGFQNPTVREMKADGSYLRDFAVPTKYQPLGSAASTVAAAGDRGIYNNLAFESLAISTDGKTLYTATENALTQDGPTAGLGHGSPSRILSFDIATGAAGAEYVYQVGPVVDTPDPAGGFVTNGLTDLLAVGDRQFIGIERSFSLGKDYEIRLYAIDARSATDVSGLDSLEGASFTAVTKTLLLDLGDLKNDDGSALVLDNIEGITLGPVVDGRQTIVLVADNNFAGNQFTQFVALSLVPEPATAGLWAAGLAGVFITARRKR
ncbi:MAG: esterase-like activity of phytase family protein [Aquabacterium sp.]|nr:MAG: esterase-like activity of phytase family protein [Aquabacterium sp.]